MFKRSLQHKIYLLTGNVYLSRKLKYVFASITEECSINSHTKNSNEKYTFDYPRFVVLSP